MQVMFARPQNTGCMYGQNKNKPGMGESYSPRNGNQKNNKKDKKDEKMKEKECTGDKRDLKKQSCLGYPRQGYGR